MVLLICGRRLFLPMLLAKFQGILAAQGYAGMVVIIDRLARAVTLIKWLALPWDDNDPYWPTTDTWTGRALAANAQLKASWREFVREEIIESESTVSAGEEKGPGNNAGTTT